MSVSCTVSEILIVQWRRDIQYWVRGHWNWHQSITS